MKFFGTKPFQLLFMLTAVAIVGGCESASAVATATSPTSATKCQASFDPSARVVAAGETATVSISTQPECTWSAQSQASWITHVSPASSQGSGQLQFRVAANPSTTARVGEVVVNGDAITVTQEAAPPAPARGGTGGTSPPRGGDDDDEDDEGEDDGGSSGKGKKGKS
jgi:hypothetical protein